MRETRDSEDGVGEAGEAEGEMGEGVGEIEEAEGEMGEGVGEIEGVAAESKASSQLTCSKSLMPSPESSAPAPARENRLVARDGLMA